MKTYQDLLAIDENELGRMEFVLYAIQECKYLRKRINRAKKRIEEAYDEGTGGKISS